MAYSAIQVLTSVPLPVSLSKHLFRHEIYSRAYSITNGFAD